MENVCSEITLDVKIPEESNDTSPAKSMKREPDQHSEEAMKYLIGEIYEISDDEGNDTEAEVANYMAPSFSRKEPLKW